MMENGYEGAYLEALHHERSDGGAFVGLHIDWNADKKEHIVAVGDTHRIEIAQHVAARYPTLQK